MQGRDLEHWDLENKWNKAWQPPYREVDQQLRPWQKIGVTFVMQRYLAGAWFAVIGDEIGIGKVTTDESYSILTLHRPYRL
jgi:hypothetical protein